MISSWREAEGRGFITPSDGGFDVLFYKRDLATDEPVCAGLPVTYTLSAKSGKLEFSRAVKVELAR